MILYDLDAIDDLAIQYAIQVEQYNESNPNLSGPKLHRTTAFGENQHIPVGTKKPGQPNLVMGPNSRWINPRGQQPTQQAPPPPEIPKVEIGPENASQPVPEGKNFGTRTGHTIHTTQGGQVEVRGQDGKSMGKFNALNLGQLAKKAHGIIQGMRLGPGGTDVQPQQGFQKKGPAFEGLKLEGKQPEGKQPAGKFEKQVDPPPRPPGQTGQMIKEGAKVVGGAIGAEAKELATKARDLASTNPKMAAAIVRGEEAVGKVKDAAAELKDRRPIGDTGFADALRQAREFRQQGTPPKPRAAEDIQPKNLPVPEPSQVKALRERQAEEEKADRIASFEKAPGDSYIRGLKARAPEVPVETAPQETPQIEQPRAPEAAAPAEPATETRPRAPKNNIKITPQSYKNLGQTEGDARLEKLITQRKGQGWRVGYVTPEEAKAAKEEGRPPKLEYIDALKHGAKGASLLNANGARVNVASLLKAGGEIRLQDPETGRAQIDKMKQKLESPAPAAEQPAEPVQQPPAETPAAPKKTFPDKPVVFSRKTFEGRSLGETGELIRRAIDTAGKEGKVISFIDGDELARAKAEGRPPVREAITSYKPSGKLGLLVSSGLGEDKAHRNIRDILAKGGQFRVESKDDQILERQRIQRQQAKAKASKARESQQAYVKDQLPQILSEILKRKQTGDPESGKSALEMIREAKEKSGLRGDAFREAFKKNAYSQLMKAGQAWQDAKRANDTRGIEAAQKQIRELGLEPNAFLQKRLAQIGAENPDRLQKLRDSAELRKLKSYKDHLGQPPRGLMEAASPAEARQIVEDAKRRSEESMQQQEQADREKEVARRQKRAELEAQQAERDSAELERQSQIAQENEQLQQQGEQELFEPEPVSEPEPGQGIQDTELDEVGSETMEELRSQLEGIDPEEQLELADNELQQVEQLLATLDESDPRYDEKLQTLQSVQAGIKAYQASLSDSGPVEQDLQLPPQMQAEGSPGSLAGHDENGEPIYHPATVDVGHAAKQVGKTMALDSIFKRKTKPPGLFQSYLRTVSTPEVSLFAASLIEPYQRAAYDDYKAKQVATQMAVNEIVPNKIRQALKSRMAKGLDLDSAIQDYNRGSGSMKLSGFDEFMASVNQQWGGEGETDNPVMNLDILENMKDVYGPDAYNAISSAAGEGLEPFVTALIVHGTPENQPQSLERWTIEGAARWLASLPGIPDGYLDDPEVELDISPDVFTRLAVMLEEKMSKGEPPAFSSNEMRAIRKRFFPDLYVGDKEAANLTGDAFDEEVPFSAPEAWIERFAMAWAEHLTQQMEGNTGSRFMVEQYGVKPDPVVEGFRNHWIVSGAEQGVRVERYKMQMHADDAMSVANATSRSGGAVGTNPKAWQVASKLISKKDKILDFGAGRNAAQSEQWAKKGFDVTAYDFGANLTELHDPKALDSQYTVIVASNVLNVQASEKELAATIKEICQSLAPGGRLIANLPSSPRKGAYDGKDNAAANEMVSRLLESCVGGKAEIAEGGSSSPVFVIQKPDSEVRKFALAFAMSGIEAGLSVDMYARQLGFFDDSPDWQEGQGGLFDNADGEKDECGAGKPGSPGFQQGNTCAGEGSGGPVSSYTGDDGGDPDLDRAISESPEFTDEGLDQDEWEAMKAAEQPEPKNVHGFGFGTDQIPDPAKVDRAAFLTQYMPLLLKAMPKEVTDEDLQALANSDVFGDQNPFAPNSPLMQTLGKFAVDADLGSYNWVDGIESLRNDAAGRELLLDAAKQAYQDDSGMWSEEDYFDRMENIDDESGTDLAAALAPRLEAFLKQKPGLYGVGQLLETAKAIQDPLEYAIQTWENSQQSKELGDRISQGPKESHPIQSDAEAMKQAQNLPSGKWVDNEEVLQRGRDLFDKFQGMTTVDLSSIEGLKSGLYASHLERTIKQSRIKRRQSSQKRERAQKPLLGDQIASEQGDPAFEIDDIQRRHLAQMWESTKREQDHWAKALTELSKLPPDQQKTAVAQANSSAASSKDYVNLSKAIEKVKSGNVQQLPKWAQSLSADDQALAAKLLRTLANAERAHSSTPYPGKQRWKEVADEARGALEPLKEKVRGPKDPAKDPFVDRSPTGAVAKLADGRIVHLGGYHLGEGAYRAFDLKGQPVGMITEDAIDKVLSDQPNDKMVDMQSMAESWEQHPDFDGWQTNMPVALHFEKGTLVRDFNGGHIAPADLKRAAKRGYGDFLQMESLPHDMPRGHQDVFAEEYDFGTTRKQNYQRRDKLKSMFPKELRTAINGATKFSLNRWLEMIPKEFEQAARKLGMSPKDVWKIVRNQQEIPEKEPDLFDMAKNRPDPPSQAPDAEGVKQKGLLGEDYEPKPWTAKDLAEYTPLGQQPKQPPAAKPKQKGMFFGLEDDPDQNFLFEDLDPNTEGQQTLPKQPPGTRQDSLFS